MRLSLLLLITPILFVVTHYLLLGLPCLNDAWIHLSYARLIEQEGLLYGTVRDAWRAEYNFKWPLVNLLLYLADKVVGIRHPQSAFLISFTAALSVIPLYAFIKRLLRDRVIAVIASVISAFFLVKPFVMISVMKETAAQYPFYTFLLLAFLAYEEGLTSLYPLLLFSYIGLLLAHHFTLLMAFVYVGTILITKVVMDGLSKKLALALTSFVLLGLVTYAWYAFYLKAYGVMGMVRAGHVLTFFTLAMILLDYRFEPRTIRMALYGIVMAFITALTFLYALGLFKPIEYQGVGLLNALLISPHIVLMALAAYYLAYDWRNSYVTALVIAAFASCLAPFLTGNTPLNLLFITKSLDFAGPFLALAAMSVLSRRKWALYAISAVLLALLPAYTLAVIYAHLPGTSASLLSYNHAEYLSACLFTRLIERSSIYSTCDFLTLLEFVSGLKVGDIAPYLVRGVLPHGVLVLRTLNIILGMLYPSGYALTEIPDKSLRLLWLKDLVFNSAFIFTFYAD